MEVGIWTSINMPYDKEQKKRIMKNTFFSVDCEKCGKNNIVSYKCEYNDMEHRYSIRLVPKVAGDVQKDMEEYNKRMKEDKALYFARNGFVQRAVCDSNELREKILIFDEGLDDRYIEIMKLAYYRELAKTLHGDSRVMGIYFDKHGANAYHWVVVLNNRQPFTVEIDMDLYEDVKNRMKERAEEATPEGICRIYGGWAVDVVS